MSMGMRYIYLLEKGEAEVKDVEEARRQREMKYRRCRTTERMSWQANAGGVADYGLCTVKRGKIRDSDGRELDVESTDAE